MLASVTASGKVGGGSVSSPASILTRHVEQRARPPQTDACATPFMRLISRSVGPETDLTIGPPTYVMMNFGQ